MSRRTGEVASIHISPEAEGAMRSVRTVRAVPGRGRHPCGGPDRAAGRLPGGPRTRERRRRALTEPSLAASTILIFRRALRHAMREPQTETERAVFDLWTELRPDEAFIQGVDGCAGRFFVPTPARVRRILDRIARTQKTTEDPTERKLLASFRSRIELREPAGPPEAPL